MVPESEKRLQNGEIWPLHKAVYFALGSPAIAGPGVLRVNKSYMKICFRPKSVYGLRIG